MILVEKKVLKEKKNYLNMVTQQKKNIKLSEKKKYTNNESVKNKFVSDKSSLTKLSIGKIGTKKPNKSLSAKGNHLKGWYDPEFLKSKWVTKKPYNFFKKFSYKPISLEDKKRSFLYKCSLLGLTQLKYFKYLYFHFRYNRYKRFYKFRKKYRYVLLKIRRRITKKKYLHLVFSFYKKYNLVFYKRQILNDRKNRVFRNIKRFSIRKINKFDKLKMLNYLTNNISKMGRKKKAYTIVLNLLILFKYKYRKNIFKYIEESINNVKPLVNFKTLYIGGKKYKIPVLLNYSRSHKYALKWIINTAEENKKNNFILALLNEFIDSSQNNSQTVKKRKEHHLLAYENKSYIRFLRFFKS